MSAETLLGRCFMSIMLLTEMLMGEEGFLLFQKSVDRIELLARIVLFVGLFFVGHEKHYYRMNEGLSVLSKKDYGTTWNGLAPIDQGWTFDLYQPKHYSTIINPPNLTKLSTSQVDLPQSWSQGQKSIHPVWLILIWDLYCTSVWVELSKLGLLMSHLVFTTFPPILSPAHYILWHLPLFP